jgi:anthranilate phosphoribosyltransferase
VLKPFIQKVTERTNLSQGDAAIAMEIIMSGGATPAQIGAFLVALRMKGETADELAGLATTMRARAVPLATPDGDLIDTCGTGGDGAGTFNVSTAAALVAAGAGITVAKHGNRSVSSRCGSADVLEALGVKIEASAPTVNRCLREVGIGFLFAPLFHQAMKQAAGPRKELGLRTAFNLLGPLTNPARPKRQMVGVYDPELTELFAAVLQKLGTERALVCSGLDGLDELSLSGESKITELANGAICTYMVKPEDFGLTRVPKAKLIGGQASENAAILSRLLAGENGPTRDVVLLNAGAAIYMAGAAKTIAAGIDVAKKSIDTGAAQKKLERLVAVSQKSVS